MAHRTMTVSHIARALAGAAEVGSDRDLLARYVGSADQAAFAALAARHAGMVLGVCQRALPRAVDAEDTCQAVFLLLAQKASRVRWQSSVAGWLYTAARRVARNARLSAERRARREARAAVPEAVAPVDAMTGGELTAVLDHELSRLAPRYRDPLVLCCLEGLAQDEAASRLGVPIETLRHCASNAVANAWPPHYRRVGATSALPSWPSPPRPRRRQHRGWSNRFRLPGPGPRRPLLSPSLAASDIRS